jgi:hypothetical protein
MCWYLFLLYLPQLPHTLVFLRPVPRLRILRLVWWYAICDAQGLRDILLCVAQLQSSRWGDNRSWELKLHDRLISIFCACSFFSDNQVLVFADMHGDPHYIRLDTLLVVAAATAPDLHPTSVHLSPLYPTRSIPPFCLVQFSLTCSTYLVLPSCVSCHSLLCASSCATGPLALPVCRHILKLHVLIF